MSRLLYIVDGYNVIHALFPRSAHEDLARRRDWLVEQLSSLAAVRGAAAVVVFDVRGSTGVTCERLRGTAVEVCFAGGPYAADAFIARRIQAQPPDVTVFVVSGDQEVQRTAARAGVHRMTPKELLGELRTLEQRLEEVLANGRSSARIPSQLEHKVDVETLRKLERLRMEGLEPPDEAGDPSSSA